MRSRITRHRYPGSVMTRAPIPVMRTPMTDHKRSDRLQTNNPPRMSGARRLAWGAAFGILLFGAGYLINETGAFSFSLTSETGATTQIGDAVYTRESMAADRKANYQDRTKPAPSTPVGA